MPPKSSSALSSPTPFFSPLGILNSPQNLSKLRGSLQMVQAVQIVQTVETETLVDEQSFSRPSGSRRAVLLVHSRSTVEQKGLKSTLSSYVMFPQSVDPRKE